MKKRKINKNKLKYILPIVLILLGVLITIKIFSPYYKIEDRVSEMKKFKGANNEKAIGWVRVQGTNIDFPIVYYNTSDVSDPTYDLGWNYSNDETLQTKTTIFSHNILNVSSKPLIGEKTHKRFEQLMAYLYTDFSKENKYIQYTTGDKNYLFKIYGVSFQKEANLDYKNINPSKSQMKKYIKYTKENSYFDFNIDVNENDKLITLVTCTRFFGPTTEYSFVIDGRMVRENELTNNYKIKEKKNYKEIKKIMEGDAENV
mgnify:CR=1 FL=1